MVYDWQLTGWPKFTYDVAQIQSIILAFAQQTGEMTGRTQGLTNKLKQEAILQLMLCLGRRRQ